MCDINLGMCFMTEVGMHANNADKIIQQEENSVPLYPRGTLNDKNVIQHTHSMATQEPTLQEAESRQRQIINADYDKLDIDDYVDTTLYRRMKLKFNLGLKRTL